MNEILDMSTQILYICVAQATIVVDSFALLNKIMFTSFSFIWDDWNWLSQWQAQETLILLVWVQTLIRQDLSNMVVRSSGQGQYLQVWALHPQGREHLHRHLEVPHLQTPRVKDPRNLRRLHLS